MNPYHLASFPGPAPLVGRLKSPLGAFDDRTERQTYGESEHLRHPRDLVYHQRIGFDNACEMTGQRLPVETSVTFWQREGTYVDDTYKEVPYGSVPLWTTPPTVIQIQLQETVARDQRPHPEPRQEQLREHSRSDDHCRDRGNPDRWIQIMEETMTGDERPRDPQGKREARREESPSGGGGEDLRNVIDRLGADKESDRYKAKSQTLGQSRTRESCDPYSRRTDHNEHRKWRHKYDTGPPLAREHELLTRDQRGDDRAHKRMLRWLSDDPTRLGGHGKMERIFSRGSKKPSLPTFCINDIL
jgi:hypothetical protein